MKDETELVRRVLSGDDTAFEPLLRPYRKGMLSIAYQIMGNTEEAKEICQDVMIKVYRHLNKFQINKSFKNWLYKIVANTTYDLLRKKKRQSDIVDLHKNLKPYTEYSPERQLLNQEIREKIDICLKNLTNREKTVFLLRDTEGFSIKETAGILGSSSQSVRTHLSRARQKIRQQFDLIYPNKEVSG